MTFSPITPPNAVTAVINYNGNSYTGYQTEYVSSGYSYQDCIISPLVSVTGPVQTLGSVSQFTITFNLLIPVNNADVIPAPFLFFYGVTGLTSAITSGAGDDSSNGSVPYGNPIIPNIQRAAVIYAAFLTKPPVNPDCTYSLYTFQGKCTWANSDPYIEGIYVQYINTLVPSCASCDLEIEEFPNCPPPNVPVTKRGTVVIIATT